MTRTLIACLTLGALCLLSSQPARAAFGDVTLYETVDAINAVTTAIVVTGIIAGQSGPSTTRYSIRNLGSGGAAIDTAARCDRLALLAMSKPGKFQFGMVDDNGIATVFSCKLIVRTL
ncbi:MAG TPA: hypothetical protein VLM79_26085 [Kofleriaceae bacterium]|nr:hypothetical protein [Kofleriaceae bacterium]